MLLSKSYGFIFTAYHGEVDLQYINRKPENEFEVYDMWNYCISQCDAEDRKGLPVATNVEEDIKASFMILAKALKRHFTHILEGNKNG